MGALENLPEQYKSYFQAIKKGVDAMIDIVGDNTSQAPEGQNIGQVKATRIAEYHVIIQNGVTEIEKMLITGAVDIEGQVDALKLKPLVEEPAAAEPAIAANP
jgi:hypothetical protein